MNITEWSTITLEDFNAMQFDSGFLVKNFDPTSTEAPAHEDIVDVTSGNISFTLTPTLVDLGQDVNNLHGAFKELQYISQWSGAQLSFTSLKFSVENYKRNLGAADITGNKVKPRMYLKSTDFENIAWVGKLLGGGLVAIVMKNTISTGGVSITASKDGKGTNNVTLTGFQSIEEQGTVPAEFYAITGDVSISLDKHSATVEVDDTVKITAYPYPDNLSVTWASDNTDEATVANGVVTGKAAGTVRITATITDGSDTATDSCLVTVAPAS